MDWLVWVKKNFMHKPMTKGHKVTRMATRFYNYATIWWGKLQKKMKNQSINPTETWIEMKNLLKQKFHPVNYFSDLHSSFQDLKQGSRSVVEYSEKFMTMQACCALNGADDVLVD